MGDDNKFRKYATIADAVKAASFGIAAVEDYGGWQVIWGGYSAYALTETIKSNSYSPAINAGINASLATALLAASIGSAFTYDLRNAQIFGAASIGMLSGIAAGFFRKKAGLRSGLYYELRSKESLERKIRAENRSNWVAEKLHKQKQARREKSGFYRATQKIKKGISYAMTLASLGFAGWLTCKNAPTYADFFRNPIEHSADKVSGDDAIIRFLNSKDEKTTKEAETRLEAIIEADFTDLMGEKASLNTSISPGLNALAMSRNDKIERLNPGIIPIFRNLSEYEKIALEELAAGLGPQNSYMIDENSESFASLAKFIENNFRTLSKKELRHAATLILKDSGMIDEEISKNFSEYSAYAGTILGVTRPTPIFQYIDINKDISSLYRLVMTTGHEAGHALISRQIGAISSLGRYAAFFTSEGQIIEETACNVIGDLIAEKFARDHIENENLRKSFIAEMNSDAKNSMLEIYRKASAMQDQKQLQEYFLLLENRLKEKGIIHYTMNTARLSVTKVYSGTEFVESKLKFLSRNVKLKDFMKIVGTTHTFDALDLEYKKHGGN